jgi:hypothetical protein
MNTDDDFEVQVVGLESFTTVDEATIQACETRHAQSKDPVPKGATVLMWTRVGPKSDGSVDQTWKLQAPTGTYAGICAVSEQITTGKSSAVYLRLSKPI